VAKTDGSARRLLYPGAESGATFVGPDLIVRQQANVLVAQRFRAVDSTLVGEEFPVAQNVGVATSWGTAGSNFRGSASGTLSFIAGARQLSRLIWFTRDGKEAGVAAGGPADWSPDVRFVLYHSDDGGGSNLWAVPMGGTGSPVQLTQPGFGSADGQFSPDGRFLAFSGTVTGQREVYVQRVAALQSRFESAHHHAASPAARCDGPRARRARTRGDTP
jgi:dipeptidyl aminopeptidase/acylaminoacyl peptidase